MRAIAGDGRLVVRQDVMFAAGSATATERVVLPTELRNRMARLVVEGQSSAGATVLFDEGWQRRPVGLIVGSAQSEEEQPLLGNTYYVGLMLTNDKDPQEQEAAKELKIIFPDFGADGATHVNISGMALAKYAPNRDNGVKLMQFLSGHKAQQVYADKNFEYPVEPGLEPSPVVKSFGTLDADTLPLTDIAKNRRTASEMVDRVGLNDGPST